MRQQIVDEARTWLGVPWRHLGRNRQGIDCVGLGVVVAQALNITNYDRTDYGREPVAGLLDGLRKVATEIPLSEIKPGDFIAMRETVFPYHVAFVSEKHGVLHIIHAHARRRKVIEEPYTEEWSSAAVAAFRLPGVEE